MLQQKAKKEALYLCGVSIDYVRSMDFYPNQQ